MKVVNKLPEAYTSRMSSKQLGRTLSGEIAVLRNAVDSFLFEASGSPKEEALLTLRAKVVEVMKDLKAIKRWNALKTQRIQI